jgi:L-alanine-DL-glutamate epimerase-like enolase superfamily enzyme
VGWGHAQWDLAGKALDAPVAELHGASPLRTGLPTYANINRATVDRTPENGAITSRPGLPNAAARDEQAQDG